MTQIENVSDTARWVAMYRAMESDRQDAIFHDRFAGRLAGDRGTAILDSVPRGRAMAWAMIVRTAVFDEVILERVRNGGVDVVLNLAAGLDARPWRLPLPSTLRWIDVDLPGILDYKVEMMANEKPVCEYEAIRLDLREGPKRRALFTQLGAHARRILVVTEGLLIYLTPEQVGELARDLHEMPSFQWWLIDLANPMLLKIMERSWGKSVQAGNAPFLFAPANGTEFFRPFGWEELEFRSTMEEARRLKRQMRMMWLWRFLGSFSSAEKKKQMRRMSGIVLLERI